MPLTVYQSSAGSGKTYTLVKEYLVLCLSQENPRKYRQILAITFTNKATAEMKNRVIDALIALSMDTTPVKYVSLKLDISKTLDLPEQEISVRSKQVITSLLHHYSDFSISTIDKFTYKIVRAFAFDLNLPLHFEISLDEQSVVELVIDYLLENSRENPWLKQVLLSYLKQNTQFEKSWKLEKNLLDFAKKLLSEEAHFYVHRSVGEKTFIQIQAQLSNKQQTFKEYVLNIIQEYQQILKTCSLQEEFFNRQSVPKYINNLKKWLKNPKDPSIVKIHENTQKILEYQPKWFNNASLKKYPHETEAATPVLNKWAEDFLETFFTECAHYVTAMLVEQNLFPILLMQEIKTYQEALQKNNQQVHISELSKKIAHILQHEPTAYIYERIGEKYKHFLIDEFQDTSKLQWNNLLPLMEDSISTGHENLIVGDAKQAIYRWRGGDVEQFIHLPEKPFLQTLYRPEFVSEKELQGIFKKVFLESNYRSSSEIVHFNNKIYEQWAQYLSDEHKKMYDYHSQIPVSKNNTGFVHVEWINDIQDKSFDVEEIDETEEKLDTEGEISDYHVRKIKQSIFECLQDGYSYKHICIIARTSKELRACAHYLLEENIPIISSESLLLKSSKKINLIIQTLYWLTEPNSKLYKAQVIYKLWENNLIHTEDFIRYTQQLSNSIDSILVHVAGINLALLESKSVYEKIEYLIHLYFTDVTNDVFLLNFLDYIYQVQVNKNQSISYFLDMWEQKKDKLSIRLSEDNNAVQLITVHKSKGLEFPVVILQNINWGLEKQQSDQLFWVIPKEEYLQELPYILLPYKKELSISTYSHVYNHEKNLSWLDNINLLYVATTRASERMYIFSAQKKKKNDLHQKMLEVIQKAFPDKVTDQVFQLGTKEKRIDNELMANKPKSPATYYYGNAWQQQISLSFEYPLFKKNERVSFGNIIHSLLSEVYTETDIPKVVHKYSLLGILDNDTSQQISAVFLKLVQHPQLSKYYTAGLETYHEREISIKSGVFLRPDKIIVDKHEVVIIDYKTGIYMDSHKKQLQEYTQVVQKIFNKPCLAILVYMNKDIDIKTVTSN